MRGKFLLDPAWTEARAEAVLKRVAETTPSLKDADKLARLRRILKGPELDGRLVHTGLPFGSVIGDYEGLQFVLRWYAGQHADLDDVDETVIRHWIADYAPDLDATATDFDAFRARGGKLFIFSGLEDPIVPEPPITAWYGSVVSRYTQESVDAFIRYYRLPGRAHGGGSGVHDLNGRNEALIDWVEKGVVPGPLLGRLKDGGTRQVEPHIAL